MKSIRAANRKAENIKVVAPPAVSFSERERFVMEAALLYLPNDGTEWGPLIEKTVTFTKADKSRECLGETPAMLAMWTIELRGLEYCLSIKNWYFRLIQVAYEPYVSGDAARLGEHGRLTANWHRDSLADALIHENQFGRPLPGRPSLTSRNATMGGLQDGENNEH